MSDEKSRKELLEEPDPFLVFVSRAMEFGKKYQKEIVTAVGAVLAVVIVLSGVLYYKSHTEERAAIMFGNAIAGYNALKTGEAGTAAYEAVKTDFKDIIEKYGSTDAGKSALLQYGDVCFQMKDYDAAIAAYEQALDEMENTAFKSMILNGLAYAWEGKNDFKQAVAYFEKIADDEDGTARDQALFNMGRLYAKTGEPEKAKAAFQKLVSEFPDSMYADLAGEKIAG